MITIMVTYCDNEHVMMTGDPIAIENDPVKRPVAGSGSCGRGRGRENDGRPTQSSLNSHP